MADQSLRGWLSRLEAAGQLLRRDNLPDLRYDVPQMLAAEDGRRALLFQSGDENRPGALRLAANTVTSREQMAQCLEVEPAGLLARYLEALESPIGGRVVTSAEAPVLERREATVDLTKLPLPWHHAKDGGPYITAAVAIVKDPDTGSHNWSIHRLQLNDDRHLGILILPRHLGHLFARAEREGRDLPVAFVVGLPPALMLASQAITPYGVDESAIAGGLLREPLDLVSSPLYDIRVPAHAEYLLEGRVLCGARQPEGPFGEFPKTYGPESPKPVVVIDGLSHRSHPIFQTIMPAGREHVLLGAIPREAAIYRATRQISPNVRDVRLTFAGGCRYHANVSMDPRMAGEAKNVIVATLASAGEVKRVVVVDPDIDIGQADDVEWAIATRVQPDRDLVVISGALGSSLDPSAGPGGVTAKWGIDATIPVGDDRARYERITLPERGIRDMNQGGGVAGCA